MSPLPSDTPPDIIEFYMYWQSLPKAGLLPALGDYFDRVPPHLQPFVGIVDLYSPSDARVRLYGAGLSEITGEDPTGVPVTDLYPEELKHLAASVLWKAASRPAGYLCVRDTRSYSGLTVRSPSICLPIGTTTQSNEPQPVHLMINYSNMPKVNTSIGTEHKHCLVSGFQLTHWIDIGAGLPE